MKKILLSVTTVLAAITNMQAQSTLTAATNNPVIGDIFYGHVADTTGVSSGVGGASATWNFAFLSDQSYDTTAFIACSSAPDCDSFPGTTIAANAGGGVFEYCIANSTSLSLIGVSVTGIDIHLDGGQTTISYPITYNTIHKDTFAINLLAFGDYQVEADSMICDGWGTLILPSGTFSNVLRIHTVAIVTDTIAGTVGRTDNYAWYQAGFHHELLDVSYDTAGATSPYVTNAEYYTLTPPNAVSTIAKAKNGLIVYPNPATDILHFKFNINNPSGAAITITDLMGRTLATINDSQINSGMNDISYSISDLPGGIYIIHVKGQGINTAQQVVVSK